MWLDVQMHIAIFESLQFEGSYVGDLLCLMFVKCFHTRKTHDQLY